MESTLDRVLKLLRYHADDLHARGILHAAVFGSVARGEDGPASDVDLVVDVACGIQTFDIMDIEEMLAGMIGCHVEVVTRRSLDPVRHADIFRDMIVAF